MILGLLLSLPAHAIDLQFWGVGPMVGTMAIPSDYPFVLPSNAYKGEDDPRVKDVKGDFEFGAHGVAYPSGGGRLFGIAQLGFGTNSWRRSEFVFGWDQAIIREKDFQLLMGAGVGAGRETFPQNGDGDGYLRVNYFPVRGQVSALLRDKSRAYEVGLYGAWHLASDQEWYGGDSDEEPELPGDGYNRAVDTGVYAEIGAQATVYFGDFRTNKEERRKKKKKKG